MTDQPSGGLHLDWQDAWHSGRNRLGFSLRNFLRWAPGSYRETTIQPEAWLRSQGNINDAARRLIQEYGFSESTAVSQERLLETLSYLEWLDYSYFQWPEAFASLTNNSLRWLDAGAKNWAYVEALTAFIRRHGQPNFKLDGVELDPNRRYINFQTRRQAALSFIRNIPQATYHAGNLLDWPHPVDIISHFLPFVFKDPHLAWGLPLNYFQPQTLLEHLLSRLKPGGLLILVNQGEAEAQAQQAMLQLASERFPLQWKNLGQLPTSFIEYRYPRYGWLCMKGKGTPHERNRAKADYYPGLQK